MLSVSLLTGQGKTMRLARRGKALLMACLCVCALSWVMRATVHAQVLSQIPAKLIGKWGTGTTTSGTSYKGFFSVYLFRPDGRYEHYGEMESVTLKYFSNEAGSFSVQGRRLTLNRESGGQRAEYPHGSTSPRQRPLEPKTEVYSWQVGLNKDGRETLWLTFPTGKEDALDRMELSATIPERKSTVIRPTSVFHGAAIFIFLIAAALSLPISLFLLRRYCKAVLASMQTSVGWTPVEADHVSHIPLSGSASARPRLKLQVLDRDTRLDLVPTTSELEHRALRGPWTIGMVYATAGVIHAVITAFLSFVGSDPEVLTLRTLLMTVWVYTWPIVLTLNLVVPSDRRSKVIAAVIYFCVPLVLAAAIPSPTQTSVIYIWSQALLLWKRVAELNIFRLTENDVSAVKRLLLTLLNAVGASPTENGGRVLQPANGLATCESLAGNLDSHPSHSSIP